MSIDQTRGRITPPPEKENMTNNTAEKFLKMQDIAARLNVSRATIYRLIKAGKIPAVRVGKNYRVRPDDLEKYIADMMTPAPATNRDGGGA